MCNYQMGDYISNRNIVSQYIDETTMSARPNTAILTDDYTSARNFDNKLYNYDRMARSLVSRGIYEEDQGLASTEVLQGATINPTSTTETPWWQSALQGISSGFNSVLGLQYQQNQALIQSQQPRVSPATYVIVGILLLVVIVALITRK